MTIPRPRGQGQLPWSRRAARASGGIMLAAVLAACLLGYRADAAASEPARRATAAATALQARFGPGFYRDAQSWQSANALQATVDYMHATGSRAYLGNLETTYRAHHGSDRFVNRYYDDEGWWALAWISAYRLTGRARYLDQARDLFEDMTGGWDGTCGGGIWWSKARSYKNAIANELFLEVAARLHQLTGEAAYAGWAEREWAWLRASGMITRRNLVVDGLTACRPSLSSPTWTYNQGVLISGLTVLAGSTHDPTALPAARRIADAVIGSAELSPGGILREPCEPSGGCGSDGRLFKGIFMRDLKRLYDRVRAPRYRAYLRANASSVWHKDRRGSEFGLHWAGPFDTADTAGQVAALDVLTTQVRRPRGELRLLTRLVVNGHNFSAPHASVRR